MKYIKGILVDTKDVAYWAGIFAMAGATSLAVAFFAFNLPALIFGFAFCIIGRHLNRRTPTWA